MQHFDMNRRGMRQRRENRTLSALQPGCSLYLLQTNCGRGSALQGCALRREGIRVPQGPRRGKGREGERTHLSNFIKKKKKRAAVTAHRRWTSEQEGGEDEKTKKKKGFAAQNKDN